MIFGDSTTTYELRPDGHWWFKTGVMGKWQRGIKEKQDGSQ